MIQLLNPSDPRSTTQAIPTNGRRAERVWEPVEPLDESICGILTGLCIMHSKELCGFITADENIFRVDNIHYNPKYNFYMDERHTEEVITEIYEVRQTSITGIWHTHPNNVPWPTARDLVGWPNPALRWRYWIVTCGSVIEWSLKQ